jgi:hypothetical protein
VKELLTSLASVELCFPLLDNSVHLLNFGDEEGHIVRLFKSEAFQLSSGILDLLLKFTHEISKGCSKLDQDFLVNLVILVVDFGLHCSVADLKTTEALEVFRSIECLSALLDLVKELVPSLDVVTEQVVDATLLDIPQGLVRLPGVAVVVRFLEDVFE